MNAGFDFEYVFPAIRGVQARREFYVSMVPLRMLPKVFSFNEQGDLPAEMRHQRALNKARLPAMVRYLTEFRDSYIFSAITASIDAQVRFEEFGDTHQPGGASVSVLKTGLLHVPMNARFIINDGQHRRAAITQALEEAPDLGEECIAVVFFLDVGLERCQQMFSDLNGHAVRTSRAINILFDHRDKLGKISKRLAFECPVFKGFVEMDRSSLAARSRKLLTLSAIYSAVKDLLADRKSQSIEELLQLATGYWVCVADQFHEWKMALAGALTAGELRRDFIYVHGIGLHALGRLGRALLRDRPKTWEKDLAKLKKIDWARNNSAQWEGRAMTGGKLSKTDTNVTLTCNVLKRALGLELSAEEQRVEDNFKRGAI
jgi:DNA sulfur modification protein DndB